MNTIHLSRLCVVLLSASAFAQDAAFSTSGVACSTGSASRTASSQVVRLSGSLPIRGRTYTVTTSGPASRTGVLMWSSSADPLGIDLTSSGLTGCRRYLTGLTISVPIVLDAVGIGRTTMSAASSAPLGAE